MANTLGEAYTDSGTPQYALELLESLCEQGWSNRFTLLEIDRAELRAVALQKDEDGCRLTPKSLKSVRGKTLKYIEAMKLDSVSPDHRFSSQLQQYPYNQMPGLHLLWATKLHVYGYAHTAVKFIQLAIDNADFYHNSPDSIFNHAIELLNHHELYSRANNLLQQAVEKFPRNLHFVELLGTYYINTNRPQEAIDLLVPIIQDRGRIETADILGQAFIANGTPEGAIGLLESLKEQGLLNASGLHTLGRAKTNHSKMQSGIEVGLHLS